MEPLIPATLKTVWCDGRVDVARYQDIRIAEYTAGLLRRAASEDGVAIASVDVTEEPR